MTTVIRTWKRDGSTNEMTLEAAVDNLASNAVEFLGTVQPMPARKRIVEGRLMRGEIVETPLAWFRLDDMADITPGVGMERVG